MTNEETIAQQKCVADKVLDMLFTIDPFAIVAGGAPRDWTLGIPASDIDVFFYVHPGIQSGIIDSMLLKAGFVFTKYVDEDSVSENYRTNPLLKGVFWFNKFDTPVQLMLMHEPTFQSVVPKFPYHICKAWYKHGVIKGTDMFYAGIKDKVVIRDSNAELYGSEHLYVKKIHKKFPSPEWKHVSEQQYINELVKSRMKEN